MFLHKSVRHRPLTLHFEPFGFYLRIRGNIRIQNDSPSRRVGESTRLLIDRIVFKLLNQGCGSAFISSGSGSSILGWTPIRIRIQSGSRALMTKSFKKITAEKKFSFFLSKTAIYLPLGLHKVCPSYRKAFSSQKRPSITSKHELLQIFFYFCRPFLTSWIRIRIPNPDPLTRLNPDPIRIQIQIGNPALSKTMIIVHYIPGLFLAKLVL